MKKWIIVSLVVVMMSMLLPAGCGGGKIKELEAKNTALTADLTAKTSEAAVANADVARLNGEKTKLEADKSAALAEVKESKDKISDLEAERDVAKARGDKLQGQVFELDSQITDLQAELKESQVLSLILAAALPGYYQNPIIRRWEVENIRLYASAVVSAVSVSKKTITLSSGNDTWACPVSDYAIWVGAGSSTNFHMEDLTIGEEITVIVFYSPASQKTEAMIFYPGKGPLPFLHLD